MEIKLLHRNEIDANKWDTRVALSSNGLPYTLSSYLDLVTDSNWSALVRGDYVSIFPLPFEMKMGLKMYLQPPHSSLHIGQIQGGIAPNIIADQASFFWDVRTIPMDQAVDIIAEFDTYCRF
ncbi:peptidase dimerization domain-containing protein, partial [Saprospiraceae bacterium]|nr:peptidase dimerization domain-containing protein [Saprospiraceae bacterium]